MENKDITYIQPSPPISGFMEDQELEMLFQWARQMDSILEIGSWLGRSTHALLSGCKGTVFAVDHFKGSLGEGTAHYLAKIVDVSILLKENLKAFPNLVVMQMDSEKASTFIADKSIDMIFIDGCHEVDAVLTDMRLWLPKCKRLLCGHDWLDDRIRKALRDFQLPHQGIISGHGMWFSEVGR